jgi:8-oxo-dGTP diphosphatase
VSPANPPRRQLATLVYVQAGDKTLMLHRNARPDDVHYGKFNGLGGKFEPGESPEMCMRREVFEESGLVVERAELKGFLTFPDFAGGDDWYAFVFVVRAFSGALAAHPPEGELVWVPTAKLLDLPLWEGDRIFLPWLDGAALFSAVFCYEQGRLQRHEVQFYG